MVQDTSDSGRREEPAVGSPSASEPPETPETPAMPETPVTSATPPPATRGRRHRARRADGDASRARLLEAAGKLFASRGFAAASTRALAEAADVNLSAIAYHFGDKDGLYCAVLAHTVGDTESSIMAAARRLRVAVAAAGADRAALGRAAAEFLRAMLGAVLGDERLRWKMALMMREFYEPSAHFQVVLDASIHPLHDAVAELVGRATGRTPTAPETRLLTAALIGEVMAMGAARVVVCARLGWDDGYSPERVRFIAETLVPPMLAMLGLPAEAEAVEAGEGEAGR